jgi:hypothetical protein
MTLAEEQQWWERARYLRRTMLVLPRVERDESDEHQPANDVEADDVDAA